MAGAPTDSSHRSPVTDSVLAHPLRMRAADLPDAAAQAARTLITDAVGVGIAGASTPESQALLRTARAWGAGREARAWGTGEWLPAAHAAMVNAHQMHCLEFDAIHEPSVVHPMTVVFPVACAWTQRARAGGTVVSGRDFAKAVAVGVDIAAGLGEVVTTPLQFFRPATAGALGAIATLTVLTGAGAGAGALAGTDPDLAAGAFGVVYGALSGTMQPHEEGAQVLALQVGFNARAALCSWDLALAGFRGPRRVLEGRFGYYRLIEAGGAPEQLAERLGRQWEVERTSIKPFPSGRATHGGLDGVLTLQREHGFTAGDVASVEVRVPSMVATLVGRPPRAGLAPGAARLCLRYLIAYALREHTVHLGAYTEQARGDPGLLELAERVTVTVDANPDPNAFDPQTVLVTLKSGEKHEITLERSLGSPVRPLSGDRLAAKFRANLEVAGREADADRIYELASGILGLPDAATLIEAL